MLLLIFIFLLLFNIYQVNCYLNNYENEEISLLILAVADNNGNIAHSKQGYLWVYNGKNNNRPRYETILDIIPELRKKYDQAYRNQFGPNNKIPTPRTIIYSDVDNYFHDNLYDAAVRTYNKYFNNVGNTIGSGRKVTAEDIINNDGIDIIPKSGILVNGRNSNECFDLFIACLYGLFFSFEFVHSGH
ncbi:hypothetical protein U3516DRAFT_632223 [Neocallimastix sp. 'constans']